MNIGNHVLIKEGSSPNSIECMVLLNLSAGSVVESRAIGYVPVQSQLLTGVTQCLFHRDHVIIGKNCFVPSSVVICDNVVIQVCPPRVPLVDVR